MQVLAVVVDAFSDVEIFCDILEATGKRGVFTYLLLDHENIHLFVEMCQKLQIAASHLKVSSAKPQCEFDTRMYVKVHNTPIT